MHLHYTHVHICTHTEIHIGTHPCMHTGTYAHTDTDIRHRHTNTDSHTLTHKDTHTHTHTHTNTNYTYIRLGISRVTKQCLYTFKIVHQFCKCTEVLLLMCYMPYATKHTTFAFAMKTMQFFKPLKTNLNADWEEIVYFSIKLTKPYLYCYFSKILCPLQGPISAKMRFPLFTYKVSYGPETACAQTQ